MLTRYLVETMLGADGSALRFEDFCNQVLTADLGISIVGTSRSWDLGRDGRALTPGVPTFVATSLRKDLDKKAVSDVKRIVQQLHDKSLVLYVCFSASLSELAVAAISADLQPRLPSGSEIHVCGGNHLAELGLRHPEILERLYRGELDDLRRLLAAPPDEGADAEAQALRLALMTAGSPDSALLRTETYRAAIAGVLADRRRRTIGELARDVSHQFRLTRLLPKEVLSPIVEMMIAESEMDQQAGGFALAEQGIEFNRQATDHAAATLLAGRKHIRERIERAIGSPLSDQQFDTVWRAIQDSVSKAFYHRGQELVAAVTALMNAAVDVEAARSIPFVDDLADACSLVTSHAEQRDEIRTAIVDLFREPVGPAFDWLVQLCAGFVTVCSLGLEVQSGAKIADILGRFILVLDTDVTLSLLCPGEPEHDAVTAIQQRMKVLGGELRTAASVIREVRHHVKIAPVAYENVAEWLPGTREERLRLIDNAFVRGFAELVAKKRARLAQWSSYMAQYASRRSGDGVIDVLADEFGIVMIPEASEETELCKEVRAYVTSRLAAADNPRDQRILADKARRDAALYCDMVAFIDDLRAQRLDRECLLVSSGRRLAGLEARFQRFGSGHFVVNIATVLQLLSLVPGVSLQLGALRAYLFEGARRGDDLEKLVLRVLKAAGDVDLPFARRKFLAQEVKRRLIDSADRVGGHTRSSRDLARDLVKAAGEPAAEGSRAAEVLVGALEASATWSGKDEEIARLKRELQVRKMRR